MDLPYAHQAFIDQNLPIIKQDQRFLGLAIGGSYVSGELDSFSDLDLIVIVDDYHYPRVKMEREEIVSHYGAVLSCFSGEYGGEPDKFTCLYDQPLLHVDFHFVTLEMFKRERAEDPHVLWERGHRLSRVLLSHPAHFPRVDPQWLEDRFWVWTHYLATKLGRGEIFEVIDGLSFLRLQVLAPLARLNEDMEPRGVRFLESALPQCVPGFALTVPKGYSKEEAGSALLAMVDLYIELREELAVGVHRRRKAEKAVRAYLDTVNTGDIWAY